MRYLESIEYLYGLRHHGIKLGLENTAKLLSLLGNPEGLFHCVHVAGTNGKGSTVSMIAAVLMEAGFRTGLFTSPHLVSFTERIQVDGEQISEKDVIRLTARIRERMEKEADFRPTFFEFVTAMAFLYFKEREVQWAVVETGMGGRFDATNVISPDVTVITRVGLDHKEFLGETIQEIAYEKAGIIKEGVPLVLAPQVEDALGTILRVAEERGVPLYKYGDDFSAEISEMTAAAVRFDYSGQVTTFDTNSDVSASENKNESSRHEMLRPDPLKDLFIPFTGAHQAVNGAVAVKVIEIILAPYPSLYGRLSSLIRSGLQKTSLSGRCELINFRGIPVLLDGAHNPDAARALSETLRGQVSTFDKRSDASASENKSDPLLGLILIIGAMADKDIREILAPLLPLAKAVIFTAPSYGRAERPERLLRIAREIQRGQVSTFDTSSDVSASENKSDPLCKISRPDPQGFYTAPTVREAIEFAERLYRKGDIVVITGSFYTVGEAKEAMGERAVLADLREFR